MSTSHYSRNHADTEIKPYTPSRRHPSIQYSRPEAGDVGAETICMPIPRHIPNSKPTSGRGFVLAGLLLMLADGCGLAYFCDSFWEAVVFCCLTVPAGFFTLFAAWEVYSLNDNEDWTH